MGVWVLEDCPSSIKLCLASGFGDLLARVAPLGKQVITRKYREEGDGALEEWVKGMG